MSIEPPSYRGRFAPSPTGPLHFGSLISAVASYLDARKAGGKWLVRMEDIDPPRQPPGADGIILRQVEQHGLNWDGPVLYQSTRLEAYQQALETLIRQNRLYPCICSRETIRQQGGLHRIPCGLAEQLPNEPYAWRLKVDEAGEIQFHDVFRLNQSQHLPKEVGDFVLRRKDGLYAYQLAVVVDDQWQGISHVIRGSDLLDSTFRQIFLQRLLGYSIPVYGHIPLVVDAQGNKLSKQNLAPSLDQDPAEINVFNALCWLGFKLPESLYGASCEALLEWGVNFWPPATLKGIDAERPDNKSPGTERPNAKKPAPQ